MPNEPRQLPDFAKPPVMEVALAVQFEPIELSPAHLGMLALRMRELGFSGIEQHPPLQPIVEQFGPPRTSGRVVLEPAAPIVRHWFVSQDQTRLIQIQPDRFIHNWRKAGKEDEYPRYESIRAAFAERLGEFRNFVDREGIGDLLPNQVEVTYVNHVRGDSGHLGGPHLARVVGIAGSSYTDGFLPPAEDARAVAHYVIERDGSPIGRLHVNAFTAIDLGRDVEREEPIVVINLTARGKPFTRDIDGVLGFMDLGREWVVRGFADVTTAEMQREWERNS